MEEEELVHLSESESCHSEALNVSSDAVSDHVEQVSASLNNFPGIPISGQLSFKSSKCGVCQYVVRSVCNDLCMFKCFPASVIDDFKFSTFTSYVGLLPIAQ